MLIFSGLTICETVVFFFFLVVFRAVLPEGFVPALLSGLFVLLPLFAMVFRVFKVLEYKYCVKI